MSQIRSFFSWDFHSTRRQTSKQINKVIASDKHAGRVTIFVCTWANKQGFLHFSLLNTFWMLCQTYGLSSTQTASNISLSTNQNLLPWNSTHPHWLSSEVIPNRFDSSFTRQPIRCQYTAHSAPVYL
jgi:hypothetical protein